MSFKNTFKFNTKTITAVVIKVVSYYVCDELGTGLFAYFYSGKTVI